MTQTTKKIESLEQILEIFHEAFMAGKASRVRAICDKMGATGDKLYAMAEDYYRMKVGLM